MDRAAQVHAGQPFRTAENRQKRVLVHARYLCLATVGAELPFVGRDHQQSTLALGYVDPCS